MSDSPAPSCAAWTQQVLRAAQAGAGAAQTRDLLLAAKASGMPQDQMVACLTQLLDVAPEHYDWLGDALDWAIGWCSPHMRIFEEE